MANLLDYATLSALVYKDARPRDDNKTPLPAGWIEIVYDTGNSISGFTAGAYQNTLTNEIVIAFKGTDFSSSSPGKLLPILPPISRWVAGQGRFNYLAP
ncbi:MAG: hypothetical protein ACYCTY_04710 [Sulfuricella sp.]